MKIFRNVIFFIAGIAIIFACLEVFTRLAVCIKISAWPTTAPLYTDDPDIFYRPRSGYRNKMLGIEINSKGYRGKEFNLAKEPGFLRIVALGDSCTFGEGATSDENTYPAQLEKKLSTAVTGKVEVINAGICGHTLYQNITRLEKEIIGLKPDLLICYAGLNDIALSLDPGWDPALIIFKVRYFAKEKNALSAFKKWLFGRSLFLTKLQNIIMKIKAKANTNKLAENTRRYAQDYSRQNEIFKKYIYTSLDRIAKLGGSHRIKVIFIDFPVRDASDRESIFLQRRQMLSEEIHKIASNYPGEVFVIDLYREFERMPDRQTYFIDAVHFNDRGYSLVAQVIARQLFGEGIIE